MFTQLSPHDWLLLDPETKARLKEIFKIPRSKGMVVRNSREIVSDGHTSQDLSVLNIKTLQEFTGLDTDNFIDLFTATLGEIKKRYEHTEQSEPVAEVSPVTAGSTTEETSQGTGQNAEENQGGTIPSLGETQPDGSGSTTVSASSVSGSEPSSAEPDGKAKGKGAKGRTDGGQKA